MERRKCPGIVNSSSNPTTLHLSPAERIQFLADLIIDRIIEDQRNGSPILKKVRQK
ncbi:MAG: hypothetical protein UV83_C0003G0077 [candidate division WWE3 bacterium GW2011_GWE2_43_18]|nr:MAG: hypothetical protein UU91_C0005G0020 [candidate division WWE3 bacterium GW2011_GWB1_42_117]KKS54906.1 MAG: hypothetical protein UV21_C0004G0071 [candidate division WWE3 bacterium GW2011_GWD2_42_34]KKT05522.1 MAG: hypothetical protein UV83_C0003G0077 [candidate division WWE3 bacterium GW2011_GWE2_43_18]KKT06725.1 MAG: hypothetical protein UV84_C0004G0013 [candidate division WWE3 bacterium GW2011_GWF2_43_18]KKT08537.1 MAG: hypothetical protein UV87_C0003G0021 [candidate division WWE3 bact